MPEVTAPASNGAARPLTSREQIVEQVRVQVAALDARRDELCAELDAVDADLKAFQRALAALEPPPPHGKVPGGYRLKNGTVKRYAPRVGPERMERIERAVRETAREGDGDVCQADVRERTGIGSSAMTLAFKQLREAGVIRFARVEHRGRVRTKVYRLTRPAERQEANR